MTRKIVSAIPAAALLFLPLPGCGQEKTPGEEKEGTGMAARTSKEFRLSAFTCPEEVLYPLPEDDGGAALSELLGRTVKSGYAGMKHQEGTSLVHSPYFSLSAQGTEVPVYAAPVYIAAENKWKNPKTICKNLQKLNRVGKCNLSDEDIYKVIMKES